MGFQLVLLCLEMSPRFSAELELLEKVSFGVKQSSIHISLGHNGTEKTMFIGIASIVSVSPTSLSLDQGFPDNIIYGYPKAL